MTHPAPQPNPAWAHARRLAAKGLLHLAAGPSLTREALEQIHATAVGQLARSASPSPNPSGDPPCPTR